MSERMVRIIDNELASLPEDHPDRAFLEQERRGFALRAGILKPRLAEPQEEKQEFGGFDFRQGSFLDILNYARITRNQNQTEAGKALGFSMNDYHRLERGLHVDLGGVKAGEIFRYIGLNPDETQQLINEIDQEEKELREEIGTPLYRSTKNQSVSKNGRNSVRRVFQLKPPPPRYGGLHRIDVDLPHSFFYMHCTLGELGSLESKMPDIKRLMGLPFNKYLSALEQKSGLSNRD